MEREAPSRPARAAKRHASRALLALLVATACAPSTRGPAWGPDDVHATRPSADGGAATVPPLTLAEARARLAAAEQQDDAFGVVVYANRVIAGGGAVDVDVATFVDRLDGDLLAAAWSELDPAHPPAAEVALRLALHAHHAADDAAARTWSERVVGAPELEARARALRDEIAARGRAAVEVIAVLLPLSGDYAPLGRELQTAIELAAASDPDVRLVLLDTRGEEAGAVAAVDEAVQRHHALAILGPVGQREARAAAARAAELGVPIALLAPSARGGAPDAGVFRLWPSGEWIAEEAAREAVRRGYDALAVLAPRDEHGRAQAEAFRAAALAEGARVVAFDDYDPTATALEPDVKRFLGLDPSTNERLRQHLRREPKTGWKTFSPDVPFDLIFVPDDYQRAALVVAYLPFFNVELRTTSFVDSLALQRKHGGRIPSPVQLLGGSGWHSPGLLARGGRFVEGALVVDVCAGGEGEEFATDRAAAFAQDFRRATRRGPSPVAAQAHDAALLVLAARRAARDRAGFVAALLAARVDDGACGEASVGADGEIVRRALVLRIDGGEFMLDLD